MALVTWDDIGSSLEQAEENAGQGTVPTGQNFPIQTSLGELSIVDTGFESNFQSTLATVKAATYDKSESGALTSGYFAIKSARRNQYSSSLYNDFFVTGFRVSALNLPTDTIYKGLFLLRVPKVVGSVSLYDYFLCASCSNESPSVGSPIASALYNSLYQPNRVIGSGCFVRNFAPSYLYNLYTNSVTTNAKWRTFLTSIESAVVSAGLPGIRALTASVYWGYDRECLPSLLGYTSSDAPVLAPEQCYLVSTNLPVWDITDETHADDIINYLSTGTRSNTWYDGQTEPYEPAIDADVNDTTTVWNVQSLYDTNPTYRINYYCTALGAVGASIRSQWRGNIFVDSIKTPVTGEVFREFNKGDIVLYDKSYTYHKSVFSIKYSDLYDKIMQFIYSRIGDGSYVPPASETWLGNVWLNKNQAYIIRLGMCIYNSTKISNIVYVDLKYDPTTGLSWGTLVDNGDDSYVNITVVSDSSIEDAGGVVGIDIPTADDGYTGVIDEVNSEEDPEYEDAGSADLPTDTITPVSGSGVSVGGRFCTTYQVSTAQLKAISSYFWNDGADGFMSKYINAVNNPIESIISVGYMPISVTGVGSDSVFIGNVNLTAQDPDCTGATVANTTQKVVIGTLDIPEVYSSFLDYQPYTNLTIFLPFIGFKTLPPNLFMGKTLKVEYAFDLITGGCKALLSANGKYVMCFDGDCMIKIPLTASNNSDVFMQRLRSAVEAGVNIMSAGVGTVATTSGGSRTVSGERFGRTNREAQAGRAMRRIQSWSETSTKEPTTFHSHNYGGVVANVVGAGLDIAMAKHTYETFGGASSAVASVEPMSVYVIIDSPTVQYPATYNHNCGKPCELSKYLSSLTGYTEVDGGIDLNGIPCTDAEREEIHALLVSGVYL